METTLILGELQLCTYEHGFARSRDVLEDIDLPAGFQGPLGLG